MIMILESGDNFLNLLQSEGVPKKKGRGVSNPGGNYGGLWFYFDWSSLISLLDLALSKCEKFLHDEIDGVHR